MSLDTKVKNLIINTNMTKEQYEAVDDKSNQLFFVEDSSVVDVPAPEENQSGYLHTDGVNITWKEIELGGDYLPLSGGTLIGNVEFAQPETGTDTYYMELHQSNDRKYRLGSSASGSSQGFCIGVMKKYANGSGAYLARYAFTQNEFTPYDNDSSLGCRDFQWINVYTKKLNNGADLAVPTEGGTLARLEDIPESTQVETIPEASTDNVGKIIQYIGETNDTYTNGYFYNYVQSVTSIATGRIIGLDAVITVDTEKFLAQNPVLVEGLGPYPSMRGDYNGSAWDIWSQDPNITISKEDLVNVWGVTITNPDGTPYEPNVGDSFGLYLEESSTYGWQQIDVQPSSGGSALPDQTDNAGKFLMTDGESASWAAAVVNNAGTDSDIGIGKDIDVKSGIGIGTSVKVDSLNNTVGGRAIAIGVYAQASTSGSTHSDIAIGQLAKADGTYAIAIGARGTAATAQYAIQLGSAGTNNDANTFKVANENGNFEIMSADGTIPTDRYTTTPTDAGTYVPKLTIAEDGTATREWSTEFNNTMVVPTPPTDNGTYVLKATVVDGVVTTEWVLEA